MSKDCSVYHVPIMPQTCLEYLNIQREGTYLDGTCGGGGHSSLIYAQLGAGGRLISLDQDRQALEETKCRSEYTERPVDPDWTLVQSNFRFFRRVLAQEKVQKLSGALLDLGVSSAQLDRADRGFSYLQDGPLDMRMDGASNLTAATVVNTYSEAALTKIFRNYGEERYASRIAGAIVKDREQKPFETTKQLADLVVRMMPSTSRHEKQHPAKRVFQAIRIEVNQELSSLEDFLKDAPGAFQEGGRLCILTFHSLEDRLVKEAMRLWENPCTCPADFPVCRCGRQPVGKRVTHKPVVATSEEVQMNPRARSAKLRVFEWNGKELEG